MKQALRVVALLILLAVVGVGIFLATFDADRYRPLLVAKLQNAIGRPVTLARLSLGWRNGIAVQLRDLSILEEAPAAGEPLDSPPARSGRMPSGVEAEPLVQIESASALVRLGPLLRKEVQVSSVLLSRPQIRLARDTQGKLNVLGLVAVASPAAGAARSTTVGDTPVSLNIGSFRVEDGTLHWTDALTSPPTDLWLKQVDCVVRNIAPGTPMDIDLKAALGAAGQNLHLSGRLTLPDHPHAGSLEQGTFAVEDLVLQDILPGVRQGVPQLQGRLSITVQGSAATLSPSRIRQAVTANGRLKLTEARVANLNVVRAVFEKISVIPGLLQALEARLPETYQAKLAAPDTVLSPIDVPLRVEAGSLQLDDLLVRSETFVLSGSGRVGLDGTMDIRAILRIEPVLSAAFIKSVNELQALADASGQLEIPLTVQGHAPQVAVFPDLNDLASKLVVTKVQDLLGSFLQKALERTSPEAPPQQQ